MSNLENLREFSDNQNLLFGIRVNLDFTNKYH